MVVVIHGKDGGVEGSGKVLGEGRFPAGGHSGDCDDSGICHVVFALTIMRDDRGGLGDVALEDFWGRGVKKVVEEIWFRCKKIKLALVTQNME